MVTLRPMGVQWCRPCGQRWLSACATQSGVGAELECGPGWAPCSGRQQHRQLEQGQEQQLLVSLPGPPTSLSSLGSGLPAAGGAAGEAAHCCCARCCSRCCSFTTPDAHCCCVRCCFLTLPPQAHTAVVCAAAHPAAPLPNLTHTASTHTHTYTHTDNPSFLLRSTRPPGWERRSDWAG